MIDEHEIERVAARLGSAANAERVVLFGSYARGEAREDSDVDLMIIAESEQPRFKRSRELYKLLGPKTLNNRPSKVISVFPRASLKRHAIPSLRHINNLPIKTYSSPESFEPSVFVAP